MEDEFEMPDLSAPLDDATRELLSVLADSYAESIREAERQRQLLHEYRRELESKIDTVKAKGVDNAWKVKYSTSVTLANASRVPRNKMTSITARLRGESHQKVEEYIERRRIYTTEEDWMGRHPASILWYKLRADYSDEGRRNEIREKAEEARVLVAAHKETNQYRQAERNNQLFMKYTNLIATDIVREVADSLISGMCTHMMNLCKIADDASIKLVASLVPKSKAYQKGTYDKLLQGVLRDYDKDIRAALETSAVNPSVICTERVPEPAPVSKFDPPFDSKLVVAELIQNMNDAVTREKLINMETTGFQRVELEPIATPIQLPSSAGNLSLLRVLPRPMASQSLLIAGTDIGRFVVWSCPWKNGLSPGEKKASATAYRYHPTMVAYSPNLPSSERAKLTEFRECPTNMNLVVTLDAIGAVRIWSLNPLKAKKSHSGKFASGSGFVPFVPACIFIMRAPEFNLPMPVDANADAVKASLLKPQGNVVPTRVMFHPGMNFTGRTPGIMVGTVGGDLFKVNTDFNLPPGQGAPNLFTYPFVNVEYPSLAEGIAQVAGKGKLASPGTNMVLREMFHYHKASIVYLDVLQGLSDTMVSVDNSGLMALWKYKESHFRSTGWFHPYKTLKLDLAFFSYCPVPFDPKASSSRAAGEPPLPWSAYSVECDPPHAILRSLKLWRRHRVPTVSADTMLETYHPVRLQPQDNFEVIYERLLVKRAVDTRRRSLGGSNARRRSSGGGGRAENAPEPSWRMQKVQRVSHATTIHDISMSGDFADIGILISYYGHSNYSVFAQHEQRLQDRLAQLKSQQQVDLQSQQAPVDGVIAALQAAQTRAQRASPKSDGNPPPDAPSSPDGSQQSSSGASGLHGLGELALLPDEEVDWEKPKQHGVIVTIDIQEFKYHENVTTFDVDEGESLQSLFLGPLQPSIRTRLAAVHSSSRLRMFSTDSERELKSLKGFPLATPTPPFNKRIIPRTSMSVCPQMSMIAYGDNMSPNINVCFVLNDGDYEDPSRLPKEERERLGHRFRSVARLIGGMSTTSVFQNSVDRVNISKFVDTIFDAVLDKVMAAFAQRKAAQDCLSALYGSSEGLGAVEPKAWPSKDRFIAMVDVIAKAPLQLKSEQPAGAPTAAAAVAKVALNAFSSMAAK